MTEHIIENETGFIAEVFIHIKKILSSLISEKNKRQMIGENSKIYIREKYNTDKMIRSYNKFYETGRLK